MASSALPLLNAVLQSSLGCNAVQSSKGKVVSPAPFQLKCKPLFFSVRTRLFFGKHLVNSACTYRRDAHCSAAGSTRINRSHSYSEIGNNRSSRGFNVGSNDAEDDGGLSQIIFLLFLCLFLLTLPWASEHPAILLIPVLLSAAPGIGPAFLQPLAKEAFSWFVVGAKWLFATMRQKRPTPDSPAFTAHKTKMSSNGSQSRGVEHQASASPVAPQPSSHEQGYAHGRRQSHGHGKEHVARRSVDLMSNLEQL